MNIREMLKEAVENSDVKVFVYDRHKVDKDILFDYINQASDDELNGFMSHIRYVQGATGEMCRVAFYDDDKTLAVYGLQICENKRKSAPAMTIKNFGENFLNKFYSTADNSGKQIPKKPIGETDLMFGDVMTVCPNCGNGNCLVNPFNKKGFDYCPHCGQHLDWSKEE